MMGAGFYFFVQERWCTLEVGGANKRFVTSSARSNGLAKNNRGTASPKSDAATTADPSLWCRSLRGRVSSGYPAVGLISGVAAELRRPIRARVKHVEPHRPPLRVNSSDNQREDVVEAPIVFGMLIDTSCIAWLGKALDREARRRRP